MTPARKNITVKRGQGGLDEWLGEQVATPPQVGPREEVLEIEHRQKGDDTQSERPEPEPTEEVKRPLRVTLEEADQDQVQDDVEGAAQIRTWSAPRFAGDG